MLSPDDFKRILDSPEGARLEFKAAHNNFYFEDLVKYCVALANEGGGQLVLGVTDLRPRQVVGTLAFSEPGRTEAGLFERLHYRIPVEELYHDGRRVIIISVPSRAPGIAWQCEGTFWMRAGDALLLMSSDQLRAIHTETGTDFSAEPCPAAQLSDLDPAALREFRARWARKAGNNRILNRPDAELLL